MTIEKVTEQMNQVLDELIKEEQRVIEEVSKLPLDKKGNVISDIKELEKIDKKNDKLLEKLEKFQEKKNLELEELDKKMGELADSENKEEEETPVEVPKKVKKIVSVEEKLKGLSIKEIRKNFTKAENMAFASSLGISFKKSITEKDLVTIIYKKLND